VKDALHEAKMQVMVDIITLEEVFGIKIPHVSLFFFFLRNTCFT